MSKLKKINEKKLKRYLEKNKDKLSVYFQQNIAKASNIPEGTQAVK
jgi:hypothetical protein